MSAQRDWTPGIGQGWLRLAAPFALVISLGLVVVTPGIYLLNGMRAYVGGESLFSKSQKTATLHLTRYGYTRDLAEWDRYATYIPQLLAPGRSRSALLRDPPDLEGVREALLQIGNDPDDLSGMIRVVEFANWLPGVDQMLRTWDRAAAQLTDLTQTAQSLHDEIESPGARNERITDLLAELAVIDENLGRTENEFSLVMGSAARALVTIVVATAWGAGILLFAIGVLAARRFASTDRRREAAFRSMIDHASDIITIIDPEGHVLFNSAAAGNVLGYSRADIEGTSAFDRIHPDDVERVVTGLETTSEVPTTVEYRFRARDGGYRILASRGKPFELPDGTDGLVVNSRDLTVERHLEQRLSETERMESVGRLAGGVAHDFNNLISVIASTLALMRRSSTLGAEASAEFDVMESACKSAGEITGQLLTFASREVFEPRELDVNAMLRELHPMLQRVCEGPIELMLDLCEEAAVVAVDRSQIERLILNLAVNATEAMSTGGTITISTRTKVLSGEPADELASGAYVQIDVADTGGSMSEEVRAHLFEPFYTTKEGGTGLGLSICYGIATRHDGSIRAEVEAGKGTCFTTLLPRIERAAPAMVRTAISEAATTQRTKETILFVEDEPQLRRVLARFLEGAGYRVIDAADGEAALRLFESSGAIDVLMTDVSLPGMGGRELADRVRQLRPGMPVVFMSGYSEDALMREQVEAGRAHFIAKPFALPALEKRVREILDQSERVQPRA